jgi:hypothetical protein
MNQTTIEKILYGSWRPWLGKDPKTIAEAADLPIEQDDYERTWFNKVTTVPSFDRYTEVYDQCIEKGVNQQHAEFLLEMEGLTQSKDRAYCFAGYTRTLKNYLEEVARLKVRFESRNEEQDRYQFVWETIRLQVVNALLDSYLRYPTRHDYAEPQQIVSLLFKQQLNAQPPDPSPFRCTTEWLKAKVEKQLLCYYSNKASTRDLNAIAGELSREAEKQVRSAEELQQIRALARHLENGAFLIQWEASFLAKDKSRLADVDFCREWIKESKQKMMSRHVGEGDKGQAMAEIERLKDVSDWFINIFRPLESFFQGRPKSAARIWMTDVVQLSSALFKSGAGHTAYSGSERKDEKGSAADRPDNFVDYFEGQYVHKNELKQALGVVNKSIEAYLKGSEISRLTLGANIWFPRDELEAFLDEHTSSK